MAKKTRSKSEIIPIDKSMPNLEAREKNYHALLNDHRDMLADGFAEPLVRQRWAMIWGVVEAVDDNDGVDDGGEIEVVAEWISFHPTFDAGVAAANATDAFEGQPPEDEGFEPLELIDLDTLDKFEMVPKTEWIPVAVEPSEDDRG